MTEVCQNGSSRCISMRAMDHVTVTSVKVLAHYKLKIGFSDDTVREVDLAGKLRGRIAEPLRDERYFRKVRVDAELGTVAWPNGFDLDPLVLHGDFDPAR